MGKQEIKEKLKAHGYTVIAPSWYFGDPDDQSVLVNAYDKSGNPYQFYIDWGIKHASVRTYSVNGLKHDAHDVGYMFFKEARAC